MPLATNASKILGVLQSENSRFSPAVMAGALGNFRRESGPSFDPNAKAGGSLGIGQWKGSRLTDLQNFAKSLGKPINDVETQTKFFLHELDTTEKAAGDALRKATTPEEAAQIMQRLYERPRDLDPERATFARAFYNDVQDFYKKATQPSASTQQPSSASFAAKAQQFLQDSVNKLKSGLSPQSSTSGTKETSAEDAWSTAFNDAVKNLNLGATSNIKFTNYSKYFTPGSSIYSNIAGVAFPSNFSSTIASNSLGGGFGNNISSGFGNSFGGGSFGGSFSSSFG